MKRKTILIVMSSIMLVANGVLLSDMLLDDGEWLPDNEILLLTILIFTPTIILQYMLLRQKTISIKRLNIVMALNIDWFPSWYGFTLFACLLAGMHGDKLDIHIDGLPLLSLMLSPLVLLAKDPLCIVALTCLVLQLIMYILLRIALNQELEKNGIEFKEAAKGIILPQITSTLNYEEYVKDLKGKKDFMIIRSAVKENLYEFLIGDNVKFDAPLRTMPTHVVNYLNIFVEEGSVTNEQINNAMGLFDVCKKENVWLLLLYIEYQKIYEKEDYYKVQIDVPMIEKMLEKADPALKDDYTVKYIKRETKEKYGYEIIF